MCLQPLATAACCWRRAACSSWSTFIHTHRPTETSNCWLRAFWRACNATERAPARLHTHTQATAHRPSDLTEVRTHTWLVIRISVSHCWDFPLSYVFFFRSYGFLIARRTLSSAPRRRGFSLRVCVYTYYTHKYTLWGIPWKYTLKDRDYAILCTNTNIIYFLLCLFQNKNISACANIMYWWKTKKLWWTVGRMSTRGLCLCLLLLVWLQNHKDFCTKNMSAHTYKPHFWHWTS